MSLYYLQKMLYHLNRDEKVKAAFRVDLPKLLAEYELTEEEREAISQGDIGLLYVLGVNGQILMHYAAFLGIEWFDYLERMREGIDSHGPVREGIYALAGDASGVRPSSTRDSH